MAQVLQHRWQSFNELATGEPEMMLTNHYQPEPENYHKPILKVLGLGGGGCNAIARMMELGIRGVDYVAANTDHQALEANPAPVKIQLGPKVTRGLGAGGDPRIGEEAAKESAREIAAALSGAEMVFLTAGMGGGTGTGSIPVAAEIVRSLGAVAIAVVTMPFTFEIGRRQKNAAEGVARLRQRTNTLIAIPNDRLLYVAPQNLPLEMAFRLADDVLRQAVQGISELITETGMINVDFAHIRRLIRMGGGAMMSMGHGHGENKTRKALEQALHHPLLETVSLESAAGVIANFTGGDDLTLFEVQDALNYLQELTTGQTEIVMGVINDKRLEDRVQVTLVITGLGATTLEQAMSDVSRPEKAERVVVKAEEPPQPPPPPLPRPMPVQQSVNEATFTNLDLPAFLRRRARFAG
jgi:cell division protein FtsZ